MSIISIFQIITLKIINIASCQRIIITFTARPWTHLLLVHYLRSLVVDSITILLRLVWLDAFTVLRLFSALLLGGLHHNIIIITATVYYYASSRRTYDTELRQRESFPYFSTLDAHSTHRRVYALGADLVVASLIQRSKIANIAFSAPALRESSS